MSIERIETEKTNPIKQDSIAGAALQEEDASAKFARELKSCEEEKNKIQRYDCQGYLEMSYFEPNRNVILG